ncbi:MAG: ABC transporter permease [Candidatus Nanopelagicales bacterium]
MSVALDMTPAPGAAPALQRWRSQARMEFSNLMTNGEQLLLTLVIPIAVLFGMVKLGMNDVQGALPGVLTLAVLSSAFTATAIATGFERRSGVLKFLGATPLGRGGLLAGKVAATLAVIVIQWAILLTTAVTLGWRLAPSVRLLALAALILLGTAALGSWGIALAGLTRAEATLALANGIFLLLLFAGGIVIPASDLPAPVGSLVSLLPTAALATGIGSCLGTGGSLLLPTLNLLAWAAAGVLLAVRTFRWE